MEKKLETTIMAHIFQKCRAFHPCPSKVSTQTCQDPANDDARRGSELTTADEGQCPWLKAPTAGKAR